MNASYIVDKSPAETFRLLYEGDVTPTEEFWSLNGSQAATALDGILTISESLGDECNFSMDLESHDSDAVLVLTAKVKVTSSTLGADGWILSSVLGVGARFEVAAAGGSIDFYYNGSSTNHVVDVTADYVWIKLRLTATTISAWAGDTLVLDEETPYATTDNEVGFGKTSTSSGTGYQYWDFVHLEYAVNYQDSYNKLASDACTVTCSVSNAAWPVSNLINQKSNQPSVFTTNEAINIDINFGTSEENNCLVIFGHNMTSGARIKLINDSDGAFPTPDLEYYVQWSKETIVVNLQGVSNITNRYWRISIDDPDNSSVVVIGELIMGNFFTFSQNMDWGISYEKKHKNIQHVTDFGQVWSYYMNSLPSLAKINFAKIEDQTVEELFEMHEKCRGSHYPVFFIWDSVNDLQRSIYGHIGNKMAQKMDFLENSSITGMTILGLPTPILIDDDV